MWRNLNSLVVDRSQHGEQVAANFILPTELVLQVEPPVAEVIASDWFLAGLGATRR